MSDFPHQNPEHNPDPLDPRDSSASDGFDALSSYTQPQNAGEDRPGDEPPLFQNVFEVEQPREERIPNFGHLGILFLLSLCGLFCTSVLARIALYFHLFGIHSVRQALTDIHYTLGTEGIFYIITFSFSLLVFPLLWRKSLLAGLQWRGDIALQLRGRLIAAATFCFLLAVVDGWLMPGPANTPIDRIFRLPGAAWMLFGFGVTLAPFFEEVGFRGFLLPAICTAVDWTWEKATGAPQRPLDPYGHPQWSLPAMSLGALLVSLPFALMHADQTAYAIGPFLLLYCVSLVISWVRLITRSLAASVLVHACYNFLLFALMFFGTHGFRHLENM